MKSNNLIIYVLTGVCLFMTSCEDNFETIETNTSTESPKELETIFLKGRVINSNQETVADAEIKVIHADKSYTAYSNAQGDYTVEIPKNIDDAFVQVHAEDYVRSGIDKILVQEQSLTKDIVLLQEAELDYVPSVNTLAAGMLATISGRVLLESGEPASNIIVLLIDFNDIATTLLYSYVLTDENGYYSFAHNPFENFGLIAYNNCDFGVIAQSVDLNMDDIDMGVFDSELVPVSTLTVKGFVTDCNTGLGLEFGNVILDLEGEDAPIEMGIEDGFYEFEVTNCNEASCYDLIVESPLLYEEKLNFECLEITGELIEQDYTLCGEIYEHFGEIRMLLGQDSIIYENVFASQENEEWYIGESSAIDSTGIIIFTKGKEVGSHEIKFFAIFSNTIAEFSKFEGDMLPFEFIIEEIGDYISGSFEGVVVSLDGENFDVSGTYKIRI